MSDLLVWKKKIQEFYAQRSVLVDRGIRFLLALVTFFLINQNIGVMKLAASPMVTGGLAVLCTLLPPICTALAACALILAHLYVISLGVMAVSAVVFLLMFIFYCRFTPNRAFIILLTPLAFWLHIPYVVPVVCGLAFSPVAAVPVTFGTIAHYMFSYVEESSAALTSAEGITGQINLFVKSVFMNKELWVVSMAFILCICVVYTIKRMSIDNSWKIAAAIGVIVNIIVIAVGNIVLDTNVSYSGLIIGNVIAVIIGLILEFFLFSVDYTRTEHLQFEDDEYYYYVKAVPKVSIASPEKKVKKINERRDDDELEEIRRRRPKKSQGRKPARSMENEDQILLTRSLNDEFGLSKEE